MIATLVSTFVDLVGQPTISVRPVPSGERQWYAVEALPAIELGSVLDLIVEGDRARIRSASPPRSGHAFRHPRRRKGVGSGEQGRVGPPRRLGLTEVSHQRGFFRLQSGAFPAFHDEDA
jgi:hypothetical protein